MPGRRPRRENEAGCRAVAATLLVSLGLVVVIATLGLRSGHLDPDMSTALIGTALLSLLVYPMALRVLLARALGDAAPTASASDAA